MRDEGRGSGEAVRPAPKRQRILVITGDPVGEKMAGPAIRAWHIAAVLAGEHDVRLVSMNGVSRTDAPFQLGEVSHHVPSSMNEHEAWADIIVLQGHALALFPVLERSEKILVVDIYDPIHLEQLEQGRGQEIGIWSTQVLEATRSLNHQLALGDFFLCASERQRLFWLGQLAGVGRVNPLTYAQDPDLGRLLALAPFGIQATEPEHTRAAVKGVMPGVGVDDKLVIWAGGIYNWFDPETLIRSIAELAGRRADVRLLFLGVAHPNPDVPEMEIVARCRALAADLGVLGTHVFFNEQWVEYEDRQNYLLEADAGVSTHFQHIETTFSFRTRILDYLWAGLPIVTTDGDSFAELVQRETLGRVVPERDVGALAAALESVLYDEDTRISAARNIARVRESFRWETTLADLAEFCRTPSHAADRSGEGRAVGSVLLMRERPPVGWRRDLERVAHHLRAGGPRAVASKVLSRVRRTIDFRRKGR
jgi:glycosyltransferase involved in cell wall biosynthesis